jgi:hypothetical protein
MKGILSFFRSTSGSLGASNEIVKAARMAAQNEGCVAIDNELLQFPQSARLYRVQHRKLHRLADLLEARRAGHVLSPVERVAVRLALDTLRKKLGKS